jgi:hypothetical protein
VAQPAHVLDVLTTSDRQFVPTKAMLTAALDGALDLPTSPLLQTLSDGSALDLPTSPLQKTLSSLR